MRSITPRGRSAHGPRRIVQPNATRRPGAPVLGSLALAVVAVGLLVSACGSPASTTTAASTSSSTAPLPTGPIVGPTVSSSPVNTARPGTGGPGPGSTMVAEEDAMLNATHGSWKGDIGTLNFADDGTATLVISDCPLQSGQPQFGYTRSCAPQTVQGRVSVGNLELGLADLAKGQRVAFSAYIDAQGRLHLGSGGAFVATDQLQATVTNSDGSTIKVDGDTCTQVLGAAPGSTVPCQWTTQDGLQVLEIGDRLLVYDKAARVVASPQAYFGVFTR